MRRLLFVAIALLTALTVSSRADDFEIIGGGKLRDLAQRLPNALADPRVAVGDWMEVEIGFSVIPRSTQMNEMERLFKTLLGEPTRVRREVFAVTRDSVSLRLWTPGSPVPPAEYVVTRDHDFSESNVKHSIRAFSYPGVVIRQIRVLSAEHLGTEAIDALGRALPCIKTAIVMRVEAVSVANGHTTEFDGQLLNWYYSAIPINGLVRRTMTYSLPSGQNGINLTMTETVRSYRRRGH